VPQNCFAPASPTLILIPPASTLPDHDEHSRSIRIKKNKVPATNKPDGNTGCVLPKEPPYPHPKAG